MYSTNFEIFSRTESRPLRVAFRDTLYLECLRVAQGSRVREQRGEEKEIGTSGLFVCVRVRLLVRVRVRVYKFPDI